MTSRVWCLPVLVSDRREASLVAPVSDLDEVGVLLEMVTLRGLVVVALAN